MASIRYPANLAAHCPEQWSGEQLRTIDQLKAYGFAMEIYGQGIGSNAMFIRYWDDGPISWLNPAIEALIAANGDVLVLDHDHPAS